jgi:hypothetical protein
LVRVEPDVVHMKSDKLKGYRMTIKDRTLTETDLDLVSGGVRDRPDQDRINKMIADGNQGPGTVGGSIYNNQFLGSSDKLPQTGGTPV